MAGRPKSPLVVGRCEACGMNFIRPSHRIGPFCSKTCSDRHSSTTHGMSRSPEYQAWTNIKQRCFIPQTPNYDNYGGRGITMHEAWINDFPAFFAHAGPRPSPRHFIDRWPSNDGDYEPGNVRWAVVKEQLRNRRNNSLLTVNGVTRCIAEWGEITGLSFGRIKKRIQLGWPPEKCIDTQRRGSTPRSITVGGVTLGTTEWATRSGISAYTIKSRLGMGWTPQDAVTVPARKHTRGSL